jgi:hypothetical protein
MRAHPQSFASMLARECLEELECWSARHISPLAPAYLKEVVDKICSESVRKLGKPVLQSSQFDAPNADYSLNLKVV